MDSESMFTDPEERLHAMASYYGLCSWLDNNVGRILEVLKESGHADNTTIVYTSDHGDIVARGLWGMPNMDKESVKVPLIVSGPTLKAGTCDTPMSLIDLSATIPEFFNTSLEVASPGSSLLDFAGEETNSSPEDQCVKPDRIHECNNLTLMLLALNCPWIY